ncbi:MAG: hypothetical protein ACK559_29250, partial [bacterium]
TLALSSAASDVYNRQPYTHARGDPCKLTMEDLFPSRPEPPTSENTNQPEDESEDWLIEWDRENMDRKNN